MADNNTTTTDTTKVEQVKSDNGYIVSPTVTGSGQTSDLIETALAPTVRASGLVKKTDTEYFYKFARFPYMDPYARVTGTREYVFFTKPDLFIFNKDSGNLSGFVKNVPFFENCLKTNRDSLYQLQYSATSGKFPFMNVLTNAKRSNLDLPGISTQNDMETAANLFDTKMSYRGTSYSSDENHDFSIEFEDTKNLDIYMLFKAYDEYERRKYYGYFDLFKNQNQYLTYVQNKIIHDQFSIFKFIVTEDGSTILHYSKMYGCYPKSVPRDSFGDMNENGEIKFSINFKATFIEDMDPNILVDFNVLTDNIGGDELPLYDPDIGMTSGEWPTVPYIVAVKPENNSNARLKYQLKWRS